MTAERHTYLVSLGYRVVQYQGRYVAFYLDRAVSGPEWTREAAWAAADAHSYYR